MMLWTHTHSGITMDDHKTNWTTNDAIFSWPWPYVANFTAWIGFAINIQMKIVFVLSFFILYMNQPFSHSSNINAIQSKSNKKFLNDRYHAHNYRFEVFPLLLLYIITIILFVCIWMVREYRICITHNEYIVFNTFNR